MGVIAKSEWRGGEQKKLEKLEFDMPTTIYHIPYGMKYYVVGTVVMLGVT